MLPDKDTMCHHTGFTKSCRDCVVNHGCRKWVHILGRDPQTDKELDIHTCSDSLIPKLLIENSKLQMETGKAVLDFRNEVVKRQDRALEKDIPQLVFKRQMLLEG